MSQSPSPPPSLQRTQLGLAALLLLLAGAGLLIRGDSGGAGGAAAVLLKTGTMVAVFWLAYPQLHFLPRWLFGAFLAVSVVVAARPRLAVLLGRVLIVVLPIYLVLWLLGARVSRRGGQQRDRPS